MLRACVLLSCSFVSFTVSADNTVPVNLFSRTPASTVNFAPTNTVNRIPSSTVSFAPTNTVNRTPSSTVSFAPKNTASRVPVSTVSSVPTNTMNLSSNTVKTSLTITKAISNDSAMVQTSGVWLLVDTKDHKIEVKQGDKTVETITGIAIGRRGAGLKHHRGDDITPYGNYRIGWVGGKSNFHKFFGLNYPSVQDAEIALKRGIITERNYYDIVTAHNLNLVPPQDTPLGGKIGIHGLGAGDATVHQLFDWTHGCIALTNQQIDHLSQWIDTGTVVKIR